MHRRLFLHFMTRRRVLEFDHEDGGKVVAVDDDVKHVASFRRHVHRHLPEIVRRPGCYVIGCLMLLAFSTISLFVKFMLLNSFDEMRFMGNEQNAAGRASNFIVRQKTAFQSNRALTGDSASAKTTPHKPLPEKLQVRILQTPVQNRTGNVFVLFYQTFEKKIIFLVWKYCSLNFYYWFLVVRFQRYGSSQKAEIITNASMERRRNYVRNWILL